MSESPKCYRRVQRLMNPPKLQALLGETSYRMSECETDDVRSCSSVSSFSRPVRPCLETGKEIQATKIWYDETNPKRVRVGELGTMGMVWKTGDTSRKPGVPDGSSDFMGFRKPSGGPSRGSSDRVSGVRTKIRMGEGKTLDTKVDHLGIGSSKVIQPDSSYSVINTDPTQTDPDMLDQVAMFTGSLCVIL